MTSRDFCFWLQGFFELRDADGAPKALTAEQAQLVKDHLALVFKHEIAPSTAKTETASPAVVAPGATPGSVQKALEDFARDMQPRCSATTMIC